MFAKSTDSSLAGGLAAARASGRSVTATSLYGSVIEVSGYSVAVSGLAAHSAVGERVLLHARDGRQVLSEIIGFPDGQTRCMPFGSVEGIGPGCVARGMAPDVSRNAKPGLPVCEEWLGRIIDPFGSPLDHRGPLSVSVARRRTRGEPPNATDRARVGPRIDLGVLALNLFTTCRLGQRLGLFAGSGVGKSTLMGMIARHTDHDVVVVGLIGERGREVREFVEDELGPAGLAKAVVVVATSDTSALLRREAAYAAMAVAEHFRDAGKRVLLLLDSLTRFCAALREIGLAAGELPTARGYPPSVFFELPKLLERAGPGLELRTSLRPPGYVTAVFSVLVNGDDHNEPISDAVRGILDGHIVLDRAIAERGQYPAMDIGRSLSRLASSCLDRTEAEAVGTARSVIAVYDEVADLVRLGAYRHGADPKADAALRLRPRIDAFLRQSRDDYTSLEEAFAGLQTVLADDET